MLKASKKIQRHAKRFSSRYFRNRNVIVVCEGGVKHYPVSSTLQVLGICTVMGVLSWVSYSTGSYLAAETILQEKERKIELTTLEKRRMEEQFALLRQDLMKLNEKTDTLDNYDQFVLKQQNHMALDKPTDALDDQNQKLSNLSRNLLQERVDYLEGVVDELKTERETLVSSIRTRTRDQITVFEDIIHHTGLNLAKLSKAPKPKVKVKQVVEPAEDDDLAASEDDFGHQGGPFIPEEPAKIRKDEARLFLDLDNMVMLSDIVQALPLAKPLKNARVTSTFGRRRDPINRGLALHKGMDFVGKNNSRVQATADGKVISAGRSGAYGFLIEINHGYGVSTRYAHMKQLLVKEGSFVKKGQYIGVQGNTGRSTGSHVHYEVRFNNSAMNPEKFITAERNVF